MRDPNEVALDSSRCNWPSHQLSYSNDRNSQKTVLKRVADRNCEIDFVAAVATENCEELDGKIHMLHFEETEMTDSFPMFSMNGSQ